jgi:hypothetical protein
MNLLMVDHFLAVVGVITDPDKNKKRETRVVSEYLISGVYRNRKHRGALDIFSLTNLTPRLLQSHILG